MTALSEALRALSPLRDAQFAFSRTVRNGVVPKFPAGQAQQDGPSPAASCPASSTQTPALVGKEYGPLSEGEQYAAEQCADGRAYVFDGRGFLVD